MGKLRRFLFGSNNDDEARIMVIMVMMSSMVMWSTMILVMTMMRLMMRMVMRTTMMETDQQVPLAASRLLFATSQFLPQLAQGSPPG